MDRLRVAGSSLALVAALAAWRDQADPAGKKSALPDRLYGVTVDRLDALDKTVEALRGLSRKPAVRIVFDEDVPASRYRDAAEKIHDVGFVMGEILDSQFVKKCSL